MWGGKQQKALERLLLRCDAEGKREGSWKGEEGSVGEELGGRCEG